MRGTGVRGRYLLTKDEICSCSMLGVGGWRRPGRLRQLVRILQPPVRPLTGCQKVTRDARLAPPQRPFQREGGAFDDPVDAYSVPQTPVVLAIGSRRRTGARVVSRRWANTPTADSIDANVEMISAAPSPFCHSCRVPKFVGDTDRARMEQGDAAPSPRVSMGEPEREMRVLSTDTTGEEAAGHRK